MRTPLPLGEQILLDVIVPPIGTCLWWLKARGWADLVQLGRVSDRTKRRQEWEFWIVMFAGYVTMFGVTLYSALR